MLVFRLPLIPWPRHVELSGEDLLLRSGDAVRVQAPSARHLRLLSEHVLKKAQLKVDTQAQFRRCRGEISWYVHVSI